MSSEKSRPAGPAPRTAILTPRQVKSRRPRGEEYGPGDARVNGRSAPPRRKWYSRADVRNRFRPRHMTTRRPFLPTAAPLLAALFSLLLAAPPGRAQDYPKGPINLVIPLAPGDATDTAGRGIAEE